MYGDVIPDQNKIAEVLVQYFEKNFEFKKSENVDSLLDVIPTIISHEDQNMLDKISYEEEIKDTLFNKDPDSSPGPDGFSGCFYRAC